ncbi:prolipoprotein diacylglyceryl transferase, partial [Candidatus Parcubacteria bacterium]|nr:prolipoprotein diacylglyceryl transferase [Candidatus Parcubacteria bacterium]
MTFYSFGVFLSLAILVGTFLVWRGGKREGFAPEKLLDLVLVSLFGGVVGGRILYVLLNFTRFRYSLLTILRFWEGEPVWYGALLGGFIAGSWFVRRNNWSIYKIGDIVAPALALGQAVGYLGCVFSGCAAPVAWPVLVFYLGLFGLITRLKKEKTFIGFPA